MCIRDRVSAADVARITFDAILENRFYVYSHPQALGNVQRRMEDIVHARKPGDPYASAPQIREQLRAGLKGSST